VVNEAFSSPKKRRSRKGKPRLNWKIRGACANFAAQMKWFIGLLIVCAATQTSSAREPKLPKALRQPQGSAPIKIGFISHEPIREDSGVVASRARTSVFWTHTDGRSPTLYAIDRQGNLLGSFPLGIAVEDWEDIAIDDAKHLYVGDIGNNDAKRREIAVYQLDEPDVTKSGSTLKPTQTWRLRFPKEPFDCESLFVFQNYGYLISKVFDDRPAEVFRFALAPTNAPVVLESVVTLKITSPVTGADISSDGKWLAMVTKSGAFVFRIDGIVARASLVEPWQSKFRDHIEGCTFVPEGLLVTSESREILLFRDAPSR
jgi:hypothetical protein